MDNNPTPATLDEVVTDTPNQLRLDPIFDTIPRGIFSGLGGHDPWVTTYVEKARKFAAEKIFPEILPEYKRVMQRYDQNIVRNGRSNPRRARLNRLQRVRFRSPLLAYQPESSEQKAHVSQLIGARFRIESASYLLSKAEESQKSMVDRLFYPTGSVFRLYDLSLRSFADGINLIVDAFAGLVEKQPRRAHTYRELLTDTTELRRKFQEQLNAEMGGCYQWVR